MRGEAEPVPQRRLETAPALVVAPTRVNGAISSGIAVAPGPLPIHDVHPEVLDGQVEHFLGRPGTRWISSMNTTSPSLSVDSTAARSPARSIAGPLVIRSGALSSAAMIMAMVVLPRPGGRKQHVIGRLAAADGTLQDQRKLLADPPLADELAEAVGRRAPSIIRSPASASGETTRSWGQRPVSRLAPRLSAERVTAGHVRPSTRSAGAQRHGDVHIWTVLAAAEPTSSSGSTAAMAWSASRGCQPRLTRRPGPDPASASRPAWAGTPAAVPAATTSAVEPEAARKLKDNPLGALPADARNRGQRREILGGDRPAQAVGAEHGEHGERQPRPDPAGGLQQLEGVPLVVVGEAVQGERVLPDHQRGRHLGLLTGPQAGQRSRRALDEQPDPADLDDRPVRRHRADDPVQVRDHRFPPIAAR